MSLRACWPSWTWAPRLSASPRVRPHENVLSRVVVGNKVVDRERVINLRPHPYEVIAIYEVHEDLIRGMWFFEGQAISEWAGVG